MSSPLNFPNNPSPGQVYTAGDGSWEWDGVKWDSGYAAKMYLPLAGGTMTGPLVLSGNAAPTAPLQAIPLQQLNSSISSAVALYLPLTGGTLTGPLLISATGDPGQSTAHAGFTATRWRFQVVAGADPSAASFDYRGYDANAVSIVGAGTAIGSRLVHIFDNLTVDSTLNVTSTGTIPNLHCTTFYLNALGSCYQSSDGWWFCSASFRAADIQSNANVNAPNGALYCGGCYWQNNGGWMYTPNSLQTNGNFQCNAQINANGQIVTGSNVIGNNSVQSNGVYFQNNSGWFYTPQNFFAGGAVGVGGSTSVYWNNNGGWNYCPVGMWCANINTGPIQQNGNSVNGGGNYNSNGTAWGGWGAQYNWTGNGYWVAFQCTDAFYTYNNQSLAGGVYWTYCDERMKWNFRSVTRDCLAAINAIELKGFDFSEGHPPQRRINPYETRNEHFIFEELPRKVKHIETGFIAQQLREIIPEAVPDPPQEGAFLSVDMRPMVATLIGAVQQLTARLKALEGK